MSKPPKNRHGGKRNGAGRKKKKSRIYDPDVAALAYLADVAAGIARPNRDRISAARAVLPYQAPRQRAPVKSPPPKDLQTKTDLSQQRETRGDWDRKVVEIRSRLGRKD
jgi:hypothetical protein